MRGMECRCVSGTRVVARNKSQEVAGISFNGYGAHHSSYPHHYLTVAPFIGAKKEDIDRFVQKLRAAYSQIATKDQND